MSIKLLFADPNLLHLEHVFSEPDRITIIVKTKSKQVLCPQCHSPSAYLHSRYVRRLADLPWLGVAVRLEVHARRLYCRHVECPQRIFCERIPTFVAPYARRTLRLNEARADETYIKVKGQWRYLYRAVDKQGQTVDFLLSKNRDKAAAIRFFKKESAR
jgi:transposase